MSRSIHELVERQASRWEADAHRAQHGDRATHRPPPIITISTALGAGGEVLARELSRQTGFQLMDREVLEAIAEDMHVQSRLVEPIDEHVRHDLDAWIEGILTGRVIHSSDYLTSLTKVIGTVMTYGNVIVLGRGAGIIVGGARALRLRIVAPLERRIHRVAEERGLKASAAAKLIEDTDAQRASFIRHSFDCDIDDEMLYDLVINTDALRVEDATEIALVAFTRKSGAATL
ncbi:MAG: cytidylate kinase-like family protein [Myxococcota bacterium]